jgi:hypothetical protein
MFGTAALLELIQVAPADRMLHLPNIVRKDVFRKT